MAARKRKRRKSTRQDTNFPGWLWMLFGLAIGLSVAVAIYFRDVPSTAAPVAADTTTPAPAKATARNPAPLDDNGEADVVAETEEASESRFDFYRLLKEMEVEIDEGETVVEKFNEPQAIVEAGTYMLLAGSFGDPANADRRRAELAMQGIESRIERVRRDGRTLHQVIIGPTSDLDRLNLVRSQLRAARIDALRVTVKE